MTAAARLEFDEITHSYTIDGARVPSVTAVLEDVGIIDYSAIPDGTRIMSLERGRFVHSLCQFDDEGSLDESTVDPRLSGYLHAWRRFRSDHGFRPDLNEHRDYCAAFGYAGTLDRRGVFEHVYGSPAPTGEALIDIKTSVAPFWAAYQTAAYANFFDSPAKYRRMAVELHADETYRVHEYRCSDFAKHLNVFLAALAVYNAKRSTR